MLLTSTCETRLNGAIVHLALVISPGWLNRAALLVHSDHANSPVHWCFMPCFLQLYNVMTWDRKEMTIPWFLLHHTVTVTFDIVRYQRHPHPLCNAYTGCQRSAPVHGFPYVLFILYHRHKKDRMLNLCSCCCFTLFLTSEDAVLYLNNPLLYLTALHLQWDGL